DLLQLRRQNRLKLYELCADYPQPLVPRELSFGVAERMTPEGPLVELDTEGLAPLLAQLQAVKPTAVAVVLLHSYRHPQHEQLLGRALRSHFPELSISLSHQVTGTFREYERAATTVADAALKPLLTSYLLNLNQRARDSQLPEVAVMQSNGGLTTAQQAADR